MREKAKLKAKGRDSEEPKAQAKFSVKLLAAKTVGAFRVAVSSLMSPEANSAGAEEFRMWSKKDLVAHATKEYRKGRLLVGQKFIKVDAICTPQRF